MNSGTAKKIKKLARARVAEGQTYTPLYKLFKKSWEKLPLNKRKLKGVE